MVSKGGGLTESELTVSRRRRGGLWPRAQRSGTRGKETPLALYSLFSSSFLSFAPAGAKETTKLICRGFHGFRPAAAAGWPTRKHEILLGCLRFKPARQCFREHRGHRHPSARARHSSPHCLLANRRGESKEQPRRPPGCSHCC